MSSGFMDFGILSAVVTVFYPYQSGHTIFNLAAIDRVLMIVDHVLSVILVMLQLAARDTPDFVVVRYVMSMPGV